MKAQVAEVRSIDVYLGEASNHRSRPLLNSRRVVVGDVWGDRPAVRNVRRFSHRNEFTHDGGVGPGIRELFINTT